MRTAVIAVSVLMVQTVGILTMSYLSQQGMDSLPQPPLEAILNGTFASRSVHPRWVENQKEGAFVELAEGCLWLKLDGGKEKTLLLNTTLVETPEGEQISFSDYTLSADLKRVLLAANHTKLWRHSYTANYYVVPISNSQLVPIVAQPLAPSHMPQRTAQWSPTGHDVAIVFESNIYVVNADTSEVTQVTTDGVPGRSPGGVDAAVSNGVPDWVYEEEVYATADALWWAPDGSAIAYLHNDDNSVPETNIPIEGSPDTRTPYTEYTWFRYPKPGFPNPTVSLEVYKFATKTKKTIDVGDLKNGDNIIGRVHWISSELLTARVFNRIQNHEDLHVSNVATGESGTWLSKDSTTGWLDMDPAILFIDGTTQFVYTEDRDGHNHLTLYDHHGDVSKPATLVRALTSGPWDIIAVLGFSPASNLILFTSTVASPTQSTISGVTLNGDITHNLPQEGGYVSGSLHPGGKWLAITSSGPGVPWSALYTLNGLELTKVVDLEDNAALKATLAKFTMPEKRYITLPTPDGDFEGYVIVPGNFDPSKKYPCLFKVYGGPGSQGVVESFGVSWDNYLATQGILVAQFDGRGTTGKGNKWKHATYMNLGELEPKDQLSAAKALPTVFPGVDGDRLALWGWSYGGYVTSRAAGAFDTDRTFKVKMAVAPVTDWRFYDSVYTERYMGLPQDNVEIYDKSSVLKYTENFDKNFLLVHGLADDNVHFMNAARLMEQLIADGKEFTTQYYPNRDHGIAGLPTRTNLYTLLLNHLKNNL